MGKHQHDQDSQELWEYFQKVIAWVRITFPHYRKQMNGIGWGFLFNEFEQTELDAAPFKKPTLLVGFLNGIGCCLNPRPNEDVGEKVQWTFVRPEARRVLRRPS